MITENIISVQDKFIKYDEMQRDFGMSEPHYHNSYEIYFMTHGECRFSVESRIYTLVKHNMLIIPPGLIHIADAYHEMSNRLIISFSKDYIDDSLAKMLNKFRNDNFYVPSDPDYVLRLFENIKKEVTNPDTISKQVAHSYLVILLEYLIRNKSSQMTNNAHRSSMTATQHLMKYVANNSNKDISISDLSDEFGYSPNYISALFKEHSGISYKKYLTLARIKNAEHLLRTTNKSITSIASECGFNDSNYFSTVFKAVRGVSPREYRRKLAKD